MATTLLSDIVNRNQYAREVLHASLRKSVFFNTGVVMRDADIQQMVSANVGNQFSFDYFNDLQDDLANVGDDSANRATPNNITASRDRAVGCLRNNAWAARNITANLSSTGDPIIAIASRVGEYWGRQYDFQTISIIKGVLADNVANDAGDMLVDQNQVAVTIQMILDARQTSGDRSGVLRTMICHSQILTALEKQGVTDKVYSDNGDYLYTTLAGIFRVVVSDAVPTAAGVKTDYYTYLVGDGVVGFGEGTAKRANAVDFDESIGDGQGEEILWSRKNYCLHPYGFDFTSANMAKVSPSNTEFEDATNWTRNVERKRVKMAVLLSSAE